MTRKGTNAAHEHAGKLRRFSSQSEAELALFAARDDALRRLEQALQTLALNLDYSPESLKELERWYFHLQTTGSLATPVAREVLERGAAMYFGEVLVRNAAFAWMVQEYVFAPGTYEIGVERGLVAIMLSTFEDLPRRPNNKLHQSIWREYRRWTS